MAGLRGDARLAARARGAEQFDPCCDRLDRRQIDTVPDPREFLARLLERRTRSARGDVACRVRVLCESPRHARTAIAGFLHPCWLRDLPLRRRQRRLVRRLRRLAVLSLELGDADRPTAPTQSTCPLSSGATWRFASCWSSESLKMNRLLSSD
jgi:hypothetical protein